MQFLSSGFWIQTCSQALLQSKPSSEKPVLGRQKDIDVFEFQGELNTSIINFTDWYALIALMVGLLGFLVSRFTPRFMERLLPTVRMATIIFGWSTIDQKGRRMSNLHLI